MEEGDKCPNDDCDGTLSYQKVENCSCHINPPCQQCANNPLTCDVCGWQENDDINMGLVCVHEGEITMDKIWKCKNCGQIIDDSNVIANGYGHTVVLEEEAEYFEDVCGPVEKIFDPDIKEK